MQVSKFPLTPCRLHNPGNRKPENRWRSDQRCPDCQLESVKDPASRFWRFLPALIPKYAVPIHVSPSEKGEDFPESPAALLNEAQTDVLGSANMTRSLSFTRFFPPPNVNKLTVETGFTERWNHQHPAHPGWSLSSCGETCWHHTESQNSEVHIQNGISHLSRCWIYFRRCFLKEPINDPTHRFYRIKNTFQSLSCTFLLQTSLGLLGFETGRKHYSWHLLSFSLNAFCLIHMIHWE